MGCLYMCATPIGNLQEMTPRCIEVLREVDVICAEDTRRTMQLLNYFSIVPKRLISYHEHNKNKQHEYILQLLAEDKNVALVSDAGYPGISDPGEELVALAIQRGVKVVSVSGANAALNALVASGLPTSQFYFVGFLPKTKKNRRAELLKIKGWDTTLVFYEAPHRLQEVLKEFLEVLDDRKIALCRELTKLHEEFFRGRISEAQVWLSKQEIRGEFVLVVGGLSCSGLLQETKELSEEEVEVLINEEFDELVAEGLDKKTAIAVLAKRLNLPKKIVYNTIVKRE